MTDATKRKRTKWLWGVGLGLFVLLAAVWFGWSLYNSLGWKISRLASSYGLVMKDPHDFLEYRSRFGPAPDVVAYYRSDLLTKGQKMRFVAEFEALMQDQGFVDLDTANGQRHEYARNRVWANPKNSQQPGVRLQCGAVEASITVEDSAYASLTERIAEWFRRLTNRP